MVRHLGQSFSSYAAHAAPDEVFKDDFQCAGSCSDHCADEWRADRSINLVAEPEEVAQREAAYYHRRRLRSRRNRTQSADRKSETAHIHFIAMRSGLARPKGSLFARRRTGPTRPKALALFIYLARRIALSPSPSASLSLSRPIEIRAIRKASRRLGNLASKNENKQLNCRLQIMPLLV